MWNLTSFKLAHIPEDKILLTPLLDFFESAPRLRDITLFDSIPKFSDAPPERIVSLPSLAELGISAGPAHSTLLDHLSIPFGALVTLNFTFNGASFPILAHIPIRSDNLRNLSHIATANLYFGSEWRGMLLTGPSGALRVLGRWRCEGARPPTGTTRLLQSLHRFDTSRCLLLGITDYNSQPNLSTPIISWPTYQLLLTMGALHTLVLIESNHLTFILTLDPKKNPDGTILCPRLEQIILYIKSPPQLHVNELSSMAEERASREVKLSAITIVSTDALAPPMELFELRKYVSRVEHKFGNESPVWDTLRMISSV